MQSPAKARLASLDVLRGVAVLLVLFRHYPAAPPTGPPSLAALSATLQRCGWAGVDLFFVLSGFLVAGLVFDELKRTGSFAPGRFLLRRGFKIYPAFHVFLASFVAWRVLRGTPPAPERVLAEGLFAQNYLTGLMPHTWSLAIEEHFYVALALSLALLARLRGSELGRRAWPAVLAFLVVAAACLLVRVEATARGDVAAAFRHTHARVDALALGVLLSWLHRHRGPWLAAFVARRRRALLAGAALLLSPTLVLDIADARVLGPGMTAVYLGWGALLLVVVHGAASPGRLGRALAWVGVSSYTIYLVHYAVRGFVLDGLHREPWALQLLAYLALALGAGALLAHVVERPARRLRERVVPSRAVAVREPAPLEPPAARAA